MPPKNLLGNGFKLLSYCGVAFLFGEGLERAFPYSFTVIHEHRWLGFWILASSLAVAARLHRADRPDFDAQSTGKGTALAAEGRFCESRSPQALKRGFSENGFFRHE